jgi:hypothetical protein
MKILKKMKLANIVPDEISFNTILKLYMNTGKLEEAEKVSAK